MGTSGMNVSNHALVAFLKECTKVKDLSRGITLHGTLTKLGLLENNLYVQATLVDMYAKCGSLSEARHVLEKLPARDVVIWNALISGYIEYGCYEDALICLKQLQLEGLSPNAVTFVCSLKACGGLQNAEKGRECHSDVAQNGYMDESVFVGNTLVDMYARCGLISEAQEVYKSLPTKDVVSYNALISGYVENGNIEGALAFLKLMANEGITPNAVTYICSIKAIGKANDKLMAREVHAETSRQGLLKKDSALSNALIDMYAKCGLLAEAQEIFDSSQCRDVVGCNALITGYADNELFEEAFTCFRNMQAEKISPDGITFVCTLKACASSGLLNEGEEIHGEIMKRGLLGGDLLVGNSLIDLYSKCGCLEEAHYIFYKMPKRDVISWNALLAGYAEHGYGEEGLDCYEQMELKGVFMDAVTLIAVAKACGVLRAFGKGQEIHAEIARKGLLEGDTFTGSALVDMYVACDAFIMAQEVFDKFPTKDTVIWNTLITGYAEHDHTQEALKCFDHMQFQGVAIDAATFVCILKACCHVGAIDTGRKVHLKVSRRGLDEGSVAIGNTLVDLYAKCGSLADAQEVLNRVMDRDVVSWNALIAGYTQLGEDDMVFLSLERMRNDGIKPNEVTLLSVLKSCSHAGLYNKGRSIYDGMANDYGILPTMEHQNCMVDLYCRAGYLCEAVAIVQRMQRPNLVVWDSIISACQMGGHMEAGFQAFDSLVQLNANDAGVYLALSHICAGICTEAQMHGNVNNSNDEMEGIFNSQKI